MQKSTIFFMFFIMMEIALVTQGRPYPSGKNEVEKKLIGGQSSNAPKGDEVLRIPIDHLLTDIRIGEDEENGGESSNASIGDEPENVQLSGQSSNIPKGDEPENVQLGGQSSNMPKGDEQENVQLVGGKQSNKPKGCGGSLKRLCSTVPCQLCRKAPPTND
ncbi:uncharacterized protein LOC126838635 isoform X23 [Adelges cooleyi]|uniref:uncharacterized protein LOC126838635 isoform X15 n=1 Tax=Adelges cooleyi TaxID=133065 RepID=UPI00218096FF|nr:uncharacterized protein LOC126838635 isoform X15 [Adelges cooleyi]XP_050429173.1 uncharacterized protein LOC126838635 isoform X16 [Adelges cooleyi]XP_050429174.1 uncharacterized protein LOC126838635 isoform X17 [Adelges cooleyi]XP_050429175.1 uncharacterized protein LOC126838635 isoform X18 [Adelges cooleyi]XP_050429176.1 uncharacterized protein LOC126838635 isoform X19 [Adelges cooleyi]XP_050429177.1 uncharacterized protein LOC126838635 isoform X20 [Adelges cooleyi]XP_050429178.1 uncharac